MSKKMTPEMMLRNMVQAYIKDHAKVTWYSDFTSNTACVLEDKLKGFKTAGFGRTPKGMKFYGYREERVAWKRAYKQAVEHYIVHFLDLALTREQLDEYTKFNAEYQAEECEREKLKDQAKLKKIARLYVEYHCKQTDFVGDEDERWFAGRWRLEVPNGDRLFCSISASVMTRCHPDDAVNYNIGEGLLQERAMKKIVKDLVGVMSIYQFIREEVERKVAQIQKLEIEEYVF